MGWDVALLREVAAHRSGWLTDVARTVMVVGQNRVSYLAAALVGVAIAWRFRGWWHLVASGIATVLAIGLAGVGKDLVGRPRPPQSLALVHAGGFGMPSDIAAMTAAAATPLILLGLHQASRAGRVLAAVLAVATLVGGMATVYLGAHWLTDVLVGWALGVLLGVTVLAALLSMRRLLARSPG